MFGDGGLPLREPVGARACSAGAEQRAARRRVHAASSHPDDRRGRRGGARRTVSRTRSLFRVLNRFGEWRHLEAHVTDLRDDRHVRGVVLNARDVTERVRLEEELTRQAFHDGLTGLANRALFRDRLDQALARSARSSEAARRAARRPRRLQAGERQPRPRRRRPAARGGRRSASARSRGRATRSRGSAATSSRCCSRAPASRRPIAVAAPAARASSPSPMSIAGRELALGASIGIVMHAGRRGGQRGARSATPTSRCTPPRKPAAAGTRSSSTTWRASSASCSGSSTSCASALERGEFSVHYQPEVDARQLGDRRRRGAAPLDARRHAATSRPARLHPGRRGDRPDHAARRVRAARGLPADGAVAARRALSASRSSPG